jgi:DNA-binding transcriptional MocR family regulator
VSLSWRDLAVAAGVGFGTVCRAVKRLKEKGWLRSDNAERGVEDSGAMVLLARPGGYTQGTAENLVLRVYPLRRAPEIGKRISPN